MQNPFDLRGQVAVITGSSKGIGRAAAEIMAGLGAKVVISSRKREVCEEVAAGIRKAGGEAITIPCNIARRDELAGLVKGAIETWGKIDTLVCNAAVNPYFGPLAGISDQRKIIHRTIRIVARSWSNCVGRELFGFAIGRLAVRLVAFKFGP